MPNLLDVNRPLAQGIVGETEDKRNEKLLRIARLKERNTLLFTQNADEKKPSDAQAYQEITEACFDFLRTRSQEDEDALAQVLEKNNLELHCYKASPVSRDKKLVARMAFNGYVDRPNEYELSPLFRNMKNNPLQRQPYKSEDYDLSYSTAWNVFKQVPEFAEIEDAVKKGLATYGIPPEKLSEIGAKDFCFIINEQFRGQYRNSAKVFSESYKARHTKRFINENEKEFRHSLLSCEGVRRDYVDALVAAMKRGLTDLTKIRDEQGNPIWKEEWKDQPVVDVHHIVNIKDCSALEEDGSKSFMNVNNYENMCFIVRHPQHDAMHALEHDLVEDRPRNDIFYNRELDEKYIYRIQPPEGVKCMVGFHNFIYDKEYLQKHSQEATKHAKAQSYYKNQQQNRNNDRFNNKGLKFKGGRLSQKHKGNNYGY